MNNYMISHHVLASDHKWNKGILNVKCSDVAVTLGQLIQMIVYSYAAPLQLENFYLVCI